jgi:uncharacterized membrane protein
MTNPSNHNPYQPPKADVSPRPEDFDAGELVPTGQSVPAGNGMQWISSAFKLFGQAPGIWILNIVILFFLTIFMAFIPILGSIATNLLMPVITAGIMLGCRALESGDRLRVEHLFAGFQNRAGQLILVGLFGLVGAIVLVIGLIILAVVLFGSGIMQNWGDEAAFATWMMEQGWMMLILLVLIATALFIPLAMALWYAPALVVFHEMEALTAMKNSFLGCVKNIVPFLLYGIVLFVLMILAVIPIGLGLLVIVPVMYASIYTSYRDIYIRT